MKIGNKVVVKPKNVFLAEVFNGITGSIVGEKIPNSHLAMLSGISHWVVEFENPVVVHGETITKCEFNEYELELV